MSDEDNKTENAAPAAPETPNTLPETSLSLEDDVAPTPAAETEAPAPADAETPPPADVPAAPEAGSDLQMETETPAPTETIAEPPAAQVPPETPPVAPTVEPPPAESGLQMESDTPAPPVDAPAAEAPAPDTPPLQTETTGGLEMAAAEEAPATPEAPAAVAGATEMNTAPEETMDADDFEEDDFSEDDGDIIDEGGDDTAVSTAPGKSKKMMMVGGVVIALAAAGAGGYLFLMGDDKPTNPTNMTATLPTNTVNPVTDTANIPSDMGFSAPPQPMMITSTESGATMPNNTMEDASAATELAASDLANDGFEDFETVEENADISEDFATDAVDGFETVDSEDSTMNAEEDIWETQNTDSDTPISFDTADAENTEQGDTETTAIEEPFDPLSEPPVDAEAAAVALDDIAEPVDETISAAGDLPPTEDITEDTVTTAEAELTDPLPSDDTLMDGIETTDANPAAEPTVEDDVIDTAETDASGIELPEFDPIPEDNGPEIMDTTEAPPQLGFDTTTETAETDADTVEDSTNIDEALAPQDPLKEPQGGLADVVPALPVTPVQDTNNAENTTANATPGTGKMETEKTGSHRDQLKEVPAQEALVRPLPKKYLIMKQRGTTTEQRVKKAMSHKSPDTALGVLDKMTSANPNDANLLMKRAIAAQRAGQKKVALSTYETILKKNPSDLRALTNMLGLLRREKPQLALSKLSELRELYPDNPGIAAQLAVSHGSVKNYKEALRFFDIAASLDVPNAYYPFSKGIILDRMGRGGEATTYYRQALKMYRQGQVGSQKISEAVLRKRLGMHY